MVPVERLALVISHEKRALQDLQNGFIPDVGIREVDEYARLCVAVGVDVEVVPASGNASADIFAVVLEVHGEERNIAFCASYEADPLDHFLSLFHGGHQGRNGVVADGHVVEVESEAGALVSHKAEEVVAGDGIYILACVADRDSERDPV